jgi:hypothetical protein
MKSPAAAPPSSLSKRIFGQRSRDPVLWTELVQLLKTVAAAVAAADASAMTQVRADLEGLSGELAHDLPGKSWPVYGALIVNLRNIVEALGDVAEAQPVEVKRPALFGRH